MKKEFEYICSDCRHIFFSIEKDAPECPECKSNSTFRRFNFIVGASGQYKRPIHSDSLAISPDQRAEHERLFPNIRLDKECRPIFDNVRDHDDYLNKIGMVKLPQKTKKLGRERIYP